MAVTFSIGAYEPPADTKPENIKCSVLGSFFWWGGGKYETCRLFLPAPPARLEGARAIHTRRREPRLTLPKALPRSVTARI